MRSSYTSTVQEAARIEPRESATSALPSFIEEIKRKAIEQALTDNRYNKTRAAAQLGITFRALRYKLIASARPARALRTSWASTDPKMLACGQIN